MVTILILFGGILLFGKVLPIILKLLVSVVTLFFESCGFLLLFSIIGFAGIFLFLLIDFVTAWIIYKIFF